MPTTGSSSSTASPKARKHVTIHRSGMLRQKWRALFIADNNLVLAKTSEHYHNLGDLKAMLAKYYPDWPVTVQGRTQ